MKIDYHAAAEMRGRDKSYAQIARQFGMTPQGVSQALKRGFTGPKTETYIGPMCRRGHDDGGGSRRYMRGSCVRCGEAARAERLARGDAPRPPKAELYTGRICLRGHDDGTGHSLRYRRGSACVECQRHRKRV